MPCRSPPRYQVAGVGPFEFGGSHTAACSNHGDYTFQVTIFPIEDRFGEFVDEIGPYTGGTSFHHADHGYVGVEAHGEWTLELE
ncbi:hypothetical protein [Natronococcus wangiae]|uniref:hypothetical protein n=1 Tax=Natronococcus wangiae TaxID=3068275 RepID=UPI00273F8037|nr:hypothetical protein [Natronococcus sp. AD5]